jgi:hypothetical protein
MKKIAIGALALGVLGILGLGAAIATQPDEIAIERTITVDAPPAVVAPYMHDLRKINEWSPWRDIDPNLVGTYSDATTGVGAWYHWTGNDEVGEGKQTIKVADKGRVVHELHFVRPMEDVAESEILWKGNGQGGTEVTWRFRQEAGFGTKAANLFLDIEGMLEGDYQRGLDDLKPLVEGAGG